MRAEKQIQLVGKDGSVVKATVKRPTIKLSNQLQALAVTLTMLKEQRNALWLATNAVNSELALASLAPEAISNDTPKDAADAATTRFADAADAQGVLLEKISEKDDAINDCLIEQFQAILNISKGDAAEVPDVDWEETDIDTVSETLNFFANGKLP